jgi:hypothetical protein
MDPNEMLTKFDIESVKNFNVVRGMFDNQSLSVRYNYTFEEYKKGLEFQAGQTQLPEVIKTMFHEITHLYQMLSTPYGYYYYSLKAFQANQVGALIRLIRDQHGIKPRFPLINVISRLKPVEKYRQVWGNMYLWYLAEIMLLYLEGDVDSLLKELTNNPMLGLKNFIEYFGEIEFYLVQFYANTGRPLSYQKPSFNVTDESRGIERLLITMKATGDIDVMSLLESGAKIAEFWRSNFEPDTDFRKLFPDSMSSSQAPYYMLINMVKNGFKAANIREFVFSYEALCELSLFGPLLPHHYKIRNPQITMRDLHPFSRFWEASRVVSDIEPIRDPRTDYERFIGQICEKKGWLTPQQMNKETFSNFTYAPVDYLSNLYNLAQQFRQAVPCAFIDYGIWYEQNDKFAAPFRYYFIHPIIEFKDNLLFHKDRDLVYFFVQQYVVQTYLRKLLLSNDFSVVLPYRADSTEIDFFTESLKNYMNMGLGVENPPIIIMAKP